MSDLMRFGRRLALPSTRQIRHELIAFGLREEARVKDLEKKKIDAEALPAAAVTAC